MVSVDDAVGDRVRQRALQSVAHLDAHPAVVLGHDQVGAVVDALAAELPRVLDADAVLFDLLGLRGRAR